MLGRLRVIRFAGVVLAFSAVPGLAMAYIDPGNGAYMVQVIFTLIGAGLFYLRHPIRSLQALGRWFSARWLGSAKASPEPETEEQSTP
jgi:hypothetical protein